MSHFLLLVKIVFLGAAIVIWSMIVINLVLTLGGFWYRRKFFQKRPSRISDFQLPAVSAIIPARNAELVIENTIRALLKMDYPKDRIELIIVNDKSTDKTAEIVERIAREDPRVRLLSWPPSAKGSGKPHTLNEGLKLCHHPIIAIYDADNKPTPDSLKKLCSVMVQEPTCAAAMGKFRCINRKKTILTRMVNIETLTFQWMIQTGRYWFSKFIMLPGTNYIIRKDVLEALRGWDEKAVTENAELSIRLQMQGHRIKFVPSSISWEQEPEDLKAWTKQRIRWIRGNNYVMKKVAKDALLFKNRKLSLEFLCIFGLYYLFLASIISSDLIFLFLSLGIILPNIPGPYLTVWLFAFLLSIAEVFFVLSYEDEDRPANFLIVAVMYFTYCQLWIYAAVKALWLDLTHKRAKE
jgi:cellulose synthase/poly-beta-1,6-N-acetylglucosamine synthase-like glycosyltransferase